MNIAGLTVNLLPKANEANRRRKTLVKVVQGSLLILLIVVIAATLTLWTLTAREARQLLAEEQRISALQERIGARSSVEQRYHIVVNRVTVAEKILSARERFDLTLERLFSIFPKGIRFVSASLVVGDDTMEVRVELPSFSAFEELLGVLRSEPLSRTVVTKLHRAIDGTFQFYLLLTFS